MTRLFRSKSCGLVSGIGAEFNPVSVTPAGSSFQDANNKEKNEEDDDDDEEELESDDNDEEHSRCNNPVSRPFTNAGSRGSYSSSSSSHNSNQQHQFAILDIVVAALKRSLVTCSVEREDLNSSLDISWPTEVRHVSHVTFDRFNGFLGLPSELQPEVSTGVPSARSISPSFLLHIISVYGSYNMNLGLGYSNQTEGSIFVEM